jgi:hypothetical protein
MEYCTTDTVLSGMLSQMQSDSRGADDGGKKLKEMSHDTRERSTDK